MRDIKFRAWHKKEQRMILFDEIGFNDEYSHLKFSSSQEENCGICAINADEDLQDFNIMQFTGLKDKNGVEIYEGDIVMTQSGKYIIKNLEYFYWIQFDDQMRVAFVDVNNNPNCEVIGNIYENKELEK